MTLGAAVSNPHGGGWELMVGLVFIEMGAESGSSPSDKAALFRDSAAFPLWGGA